MEQPEVAWDKDGTVGMVVQNLDLSLTHEGRVDLRLVGTGIFIQMEGFLGVGGWALLMDFSYNPRWHNFGIVAGSDFLFLRQNIERHMAMGTEKNRTQSLVTRESGAKNKWSVSVRANSHAVDTFDGDAVGHESTLISCHYVT